MNKILIAYFSLKGETYVNGRLEMRSIGNTEVIAGKIEALTYGNLFHIETVEPYPAGYYATTEKAQEEQRRKARPRLTAEVENMEQYDTVFLGYPNWWGTMPMAVFTFLESYDFSGKKIIPFCTHEGSGFGHSVEDLKKACPRADVRQGVAIRGGSAATADKEVVRIVDMMK